MPNIYAVFNKQCGGPGSIPGLGRFPWRRAWQPAPVFLPGESPGTEEPGGGYSPWGHKESDTTERLSTAHSTSIKQYGLGFVVQSLSHV